MVPIIALNLGTFIMTLAYVLLFRFPFTVPASISEHILIC
jgi:hypothetical protein